MAKIKFLESLVSSAINLKKKLKKIREDKRLSKYKNDPEYISLMRQLDNIDMKAKDASFELFGDAGADAQLNKILKEQTARKALKKERLAGAKYQPKPLKKESGSYETMAQKKQKKPKAKGGMVEGSDKYNKGGTKKMNPPIPQHKSDTKYNPIYLDVDVAKYRKKHSLQGMSREDIERRMAMDRESTRVIVTPVSEEIEIAKGGMIKKNKRPQMMKGGAYKGKKHSYAAGGKVNELKNFKKRKV